MMRLTILDEHGKVLLPKNISTAADLITIVEQAKTMIRDCERLAQQMAPQNHGPGSGKVPYSS